MSEEKLFGKYHDLVVIVASFILTTVLGSYFVYIFQTRSWQHQRESELREREVAAATQVFNDVSKLMDRRLYRSRQVLWGLQLGQTEKEMQKRWDDYREVLFEWNDNLNRNLALVERYFGSEMRPELDGQIHFGLRDLGERLESVRDGKRSETDLLVEASGIADQVNNHIYGFNLNMLKQIQATGVGAFRQPVHER